MKTIEFTIVHNIMLDGPFPKEELESIKGITIESKKINVLREEITITIDNDKNEEPFSLVYEIGAMVHSFSKAYKSLN